MNSKPHAGSPVGAQKLAIKVVPGSSREGIVGWLGDSLKIRVRAKPVDGKANKAVAKVIAESLQIPVGQVSLVHGTSSPRKLVEIAGLSAAEIYSRLPQKTR